MQVHAVPHSPDDEPHPADEPAAWPITEITIAGARVSPSTLSSLALKLHRAGQFALAARFGRALDEAWAAVSLGSADRDAVLRAIGDDASPGCQELRRVLGHRRGDRTRCE